MRATVLLYCAAVILLSSSSASAQVPDPAHCTLPPGVILVGSHAGVADPSGEFTIVIRDASSQPIQDISVSIDFSACTDLVLASSQPYPGLTVVCPSTVSAQTDMNGVARFRIAGSAAARWSNATSVGAQGVVRAGPASTLIGNVRVAALDQDGLDGLTGLDLGLVSCDVLGFSSAARCDFNFDGQVTFVDAGFLGTAVRNGGSTQTEQRCDGGATSVSTASASGALGLAWDNCRGGGTGLVDKGFNCLSNTGAQFQLVVSILPQTGLSALGVEADLDIISPNGQPFPDWWRFDSGACRGPESGTVQVSPSVSGSDCAIGSFSGARSVTYPYNGDPAVERVHVSSYIGGVATGVEQALFNLTVTRAKTTGTGACTGCSLPMRIVLRSLRFLQKPTLCGGPSYSDFEFTQTGGTNEVTWQTGTPSTHSITVDGSTLLDPQLRLDLNDCANFGAPQVVSLITGTHQLRGCGPGGSIDFSVDASGLVHYAPELEGVLTGEGTATLGVHEYTVHIDTQSVPDLVYMLGSGSCVAGGGIQTVHLLPGPQTIVPCSSGCPTAQPIPFAIDNEGHVTYDALLEGPLSGAGTSTLVVNSYQFLPRGDDAAPSLGLFRIVVDPAFWSLLVTNSYPGFGVVNGLHRLVSPTLYDGNTVVGRSEPHRDGDATDIAGAPVGSAGTIVSDSDFSLVPPGFEGPPGTLEVHTEVHSLNMTGGGVAVRAGIHAPDRPICAGEIEAGVGAVGLFPAESFFNMFVEVDLPLLGTLYNSDPLLVENSGITCFPPQVVYLHRHTGPVVVRFKNDDPSERWHAGDRFGWLVLAGHGFDFDTLGAVPSIRGHGTSRTFSGSLSEFEGIVDSEPEMSDTATVVVDLHDVLTFSDDTAYVQPGYRDSLANGIDQAAEYGRAGAPCAGIGVLAYLAQRVDGSPSPDDWVVDATVRGVFADRIAALTALLLAQANQSGGCLLAVESVAPRRIAIIGIQPNPSFAASTITYSLPRQARVRLQVYDLSGRLIRSLVDATLPAGIHRAEWDGTLDRAGGRSAVSGVYFVRLSVGDKTDVKRLIVVH